MDVPLEASHSTKVRGAPVAQVEDKVVQEEMTQVHTGPVETSPRDTSKQNGGIPIIITDADTPTDEYTCLPYDPEDTIYEEDGKSAKSLEEQVLELEKEVENMERNHVSDRIKPEQTVTQESKPNTSKEAVPKKGGCSCKKVFAYTFFSLFLTLTVSVCVVMFSDMNHPVANEMRTHLTFLEPTRDFLLHKYQELVNKL